MNPASWSCLGSDLQLLILSSLKQQGDKAAIQALLQTSRALRLLASSLICKITVCDVAALSHFPRHAVITEIWLVMESSESRAHMELPDVLAWLAATSAAGLRLCAVTIVSMTMPPKNQQLGTSLSALILAVGQTFPNMQNLVVMGLARSLDNEGAMTAFFQALGNHLPNITVLCVMVNGGLYDLDIPGLYDLDIPGLYDLDIPDWAACLPAGLRRIQINVVLHPVLLQLLAQMPNLTDVAAWALSKDMVGDGLNTVQSEACAWRVLRIFQFPSFQDVCRFSTWPQISLQQGNAAVTRFPSWTLGQHCPEQTLALTTAAVRLATCTDSNLSWLGNGFTLRCTEESASAVGVISALAPLADKIPTLRLEGWTVGAVLLNELALALPHTHGLDLMDCIVTSEAWVRLLTLTSITRLSFSG